MHDPTGVINHGTPFKNIGKIIKFTINDIFIIKFILYIPYNFFHNIFKGNNTARSTKFIYYYSKMYSFCLELVQQVFDHFLFMNEIRLTKQVMPVEIIS